MTNATLSLDTIEVASVSGSNITVTLTPGSSGGGGSSTLSGLTDTTISAIGSDEILYYNGSAWINQTLAEAGIAETANIGTIASQNADSVNIDGGAIDGAIIGANSSAAGTFTDLTATGIITGISADDVGALESGDNISELTNDSGFISGITGEALGDLSDVTITSIASGELLKWNGSAWVNQTLAEADIAAASDLGTLAAQDANAVDIDGGAIDGATIGASTPAAGAFTSLDASGEVTLSKESATNTDPVIVFPTDSPSAGQECGFVYFDLQGGAVGLVGAGGAYRWYADDDGFAIGTGGATVTVIYDEDDMASDSNTALATQQSIKAYVDANAGGRITGEIIMYGAASAPAGWLLCDGSTIGNTGSGADFTGAEYESLFDLVKASFGNAGTEVFGNGDTVSLPDMQGRFPLGTGNGAGLTARSLGDSGGEEDHTLTEAELAIHDHPPSNLPTFITEQFGSGGSTAWATTSGSGLRGREATTGNAGSDDPHNNMPPYLAVSFIIKV